MMGTLFLYRLPLEIFNSIAGRIILLRGTKSCGRMTGQTIELKVRRRLTQRKSKPITRNQPRKESAYPRAVNKGNYYFFLFNVKLLFADAFISCIVKCYNMTRSRNRRKNMIGFENQTCPGQVFLLLHQNHRRGWW